MNAEFLLLTHFSQRYPKMPSGHNTSTNSNTSINSNTTINSAIYPPERVGVAFDFMRASRSELKRLPLIVPQLKGLFPADDEHE